MTCFKTWGGILLAGALLTYQISRPNTGAHSVVANFSFGPNTAQICHEFSSDVIETEDPNDAEPEVNGTIENRTKSTKRFKDLIIWLEDKNGVKIKIGNDESPVEGIQIHTGGNTYKPSTLVSNSKGIATFDLPSGGHINLNASRNYRMQIKNFVQPNKLRLCMAFSDTKAGNSKHYVCQGAMSFRNDGSTVLLDASGPSHRDGFVFALENDDEASPLKGVRLEVLAMETQLTVTGAAVLDLNYAAIPGVAVNVAPGGKSITVNGLNLEEAEFVNLWVDLSQAPEEAVTIRGRGTY